MFRAEIPRDYVTASSRNCAASRVIPIAISALRAVKLQARSAPNAAAPSLFVARTLARLRGASANARIADRALSRAHARQRHPAPQGVRSALARQWSAAHLATQTVSSHDATIAAHSRLSSAALPRTGAPARRGASTRDGGGGGPPPCRT